MKFVIRDDDLNYFSTPADIERWYGDIFEQGIPVGFAAIPFVKPISDVYPRNILEEDHEYPISKNSELLMYVRNNPLIEIMQHGCTHETKNGVFEYRKSSELFEDTRRGKEELEKTFGRPVNIFVPPHDSVYNHGIRALEAVDMDIIRGVGMKNILLRPEYFSNFLKMVLYKLRHIFEKVPPAYPNVLDFGYHKEAYSYRLADHNEEYLIHGLDYADKQNGIYVLTNHLHHFSEKRKDIFIRLIASARSRGAEFVYPSQLFEDEISKTE